MPRATLVGAIVAIIVVIAAELLPQSPRRTPSIQVQLTQPIAGTLPLPSKPVLSAQSPVAGIAPEVTGSRMDWNQCVDDVSTPECIEAITPIIAAMPVLGSLSYIDLIERLDTNLVRVQKVIADESCVPPSTGWSPGGEHYGRCGAEAFAEVGQLLQGCFGRKSSDEEAADLEHSGITDMQRLAEAELQDSYVHIQNTWLEARCESLVERLDSAPGIYIAKDGLLNEHSKRRSRRATEYIERAVLLGDYRAASNFAQSGALMIGYREQLKGFDENLGGFRATLGLFALGREEEEAQLRQLHDNTETVIRKIIKHDPVMGYQQLADHQYHRFPDYYFNSPDQIDIDYLVKDTNNSPRVLAGEMPQVYSPEGNWEQRTFDMVKYQLVANRLAGRAEELHFAPAGAGKLKYISGMIDMYLDVNDLEYASQQAWEIVEQVRSKSEPGND